MIDKTKVILGFVIIILMLAFVSMFFAWYKETNKKPINTVQYVTVEKIKKVDKIKKVFVPIEKIQVVEKPILVKKVDGLPDWFTSNPDEQATASADLDRTEGGYEVLSTMNTKTGIGNIIAKEKKRSLFAFVNKKRIGAGIGYTSKDFQQVITGFAEWDFFRVGNIHTTFYGEVNSQSEAIGQFRLVYEF
jgi:hypothetical protein